MTGRDPYYSGDFLSTMRIADVVIWLPKKEPLTMEEIWVKTRKQKNLLDHLDCDHRGQQPHAPDSAL